MSMTCQKELLQANNTDMDAVIVERRSGDRRKSVKTEDIVALKEQLSIDLLDGDARIYQLAVLYIVYRTIESNKSITINQLKWLLGNEYNISDSKLEKAVATLTSRNLFNCISRWQDNSTNVTRLNCKKEVNLHFEEWLRRTLEANPEFAVFVPPIFKKKNQREPQ